jgi:hypothetical protein
MGSEACQSEVVRLSSRQVEMLQLREVGDKAGKGV